MVADIRLIPRAPAVAERWTSPGAGARMLRRRVLGPANGSALGGCARTLPFWQHLLASAPRMDGQGNLEKGLVPAGASTRADRCAGHDRVHRRWHILCGKKRGECVGKTKRGKGTKLLLLVDQHGLPWGVHIASASPHEVTLIEPLLQARQLRRLPKHLLYDLAADSDPLRTRLLRRGIQLICPHRSNRTKPPTQDGRRFRRY